MTWTVTSSRRVAAGPVGREAVLEGGSTSRVARGGGGAMLTLVLSPLPPGSRKQGCSIG